MIKITEEGIKFVTEMVETYGVASCFNNIDEDNPIEEEGLWFECPICGEPILVGEDYDLENILTYCPICDTNYDM